MTLKLRLVTSIAYALNHLRLLDAYSLLRGLAETRAAIFMYHRVGDPAENPWMIQPIKKSDFENQIRYLSNACEILPLDRLIQCIQEEDALPKKTAVSITFDDGYRDNYLYAYPILKKYDVPATIFLVTGCIGTGDLLWWDKVRYAIYNTALRKLDLDELGVYSLRSTGNRLQVGFMIHQSLKELPEQKKNLLIDKLVNMLSIDVPADLGKELNLSWDEIRDMNDNSIAFGAHTVTHPILTKLPLEQARKEIIQSKRHIEEKLGQVVTAFSYPNGNPTDFNNDIKRILKESGFACAVTAIPPRFVTPGIDLYELGRILPGHNFDTFKMSLSGLWPDLYGLLYTVRNK